MARKPHHCCCGGVPNPCENAPGISDWDAASMTYWKGASYFAEDAPNPTSGVQTNKNEMYAPPTSVNIPEETAGECQTEWFVTDFWLRECDDDVEDADTAIRCLLRIRITATADGSGG